MVAPAPLVPLDVAPLYAAVRDVPDFPKPGILFKDIMPLLADPAAFKLSIDSFAAICRSLPNGPVTKIVADAMREPAGDALAGAANGPDADATGTNMPGPMESVEGAAPEVVTHSEQILGNGDDLSPEEQAIQGIEVVPTDSDAERKEFADEDADTAALAEGRMDPPRGSDESA